MNRNLIFCCCLLLLSCSACSEAKDRTEKNRAAVAPEALKPVLVTAPVAYDTDDPAIWINPSDPNKSLIIGTDKDSNGGLYVFDLSGKIVQQVPGLKRPNNVDIAYNVLLNGQPEAIAVVTERETNKLRVFRLPDMQPADNGGIDIFTGEAERGPMGIALYTRPSDKALYAVVSRKSGPAEGYLWQYRLSDNGTGMLQATLVRKFGQYSRRKEIESIAVDQQQGYIYYSDERYGVHKYYADPDKGNSELALFATSGFVSDHEGISIYNTSDTTGYILVSNQQKNSFMVYPREGSAGDPHHHPLIAEIPVSAIESDGSEVTAIPLGSRFPKGLFVAMSNGKVFHYYDWRDLQRLIDQQQQH